MIYRFTIASKVDKLVAGQASPSYRSDIEKQETPLKTYDPESADMVFANKIAQEVIHISGALLTIFIRTNNESYDKVWDEDPDPTHKSGKKIKGFFVPVPLETELTPWGADAPNKTTVIFCREEVLKVFGERMLREDDIIEMPFNAAMANRQPKKYRILNAADSGNFRYNWLYFSCVVENITNDKNIDIDHR